MGRRRCSGVIIWMLIITSYGCLTNAADSFEDNDHDMDFFSAGKNSNFDLRHTIPGEPGIDYPIYHAVPETNFVCTGRHEGYYADTESRCQAFHICTHTARSQHGFGFLCPNGTLFSQKNFVCDWYRNVNCDESERYYSKNDVNHIGSNRDMMETVRQMIEYPMRTITKALQQSAGNRGAQVERPSIGKQTLKKELNEAAVPVNSAQQSLPIQQRRPVTRDQIENAYAYGNDASQANNVESIASGAVIASEPLYSNAAAAPVPRPKNQEKQQQQQYGQVKATERPAAPTPNQATSSGEREDVDGASRYSLDTGLNDLSIDTSSEDVYVNSLGELSTDPGVDFNRTNAHVIAEYPRKLHLEKQLNFAAKINAGLNNVVDVPSLDVLAPDYIKRIRMTKEEAVQHDLISNINGLLEEVSTDLDPNQSGYHIPSPPQTKQAFRFLSRGFESTERIRKTTPYNYQKPQQTASTVSFTPHTDTTPTTTTTPMTPTANTLEAVDTKHQKSTKDEPLQLPTFEALTLTTTAPSSDVIADSVNALKAAEINDEELNDNTLDELVTKEEKIDVNKQAENLLVAGVQLSELSNKTDSIAELKVQPTTSEQPEIAYVQIDDDADVDALIKQLAAQGIKAYSDETPTKSSTVATSTSTTTELPTEATSTMRTSTEMVTEVSSTQERLRGFRRYNSALRGSSNSNNISPSIKPLIYGKRGNVRVVPVRTPGKTTSTTPPSTTTARTTTPTLSYLKRVAASRLRLQKLTAGKTITTTTKPTTTTAKPANGTDGIGSDDAVSWDSVRNNLQRFQVHRRQRPQRPTTTPRPQLTTGATYYARAQHRFSNFKTQGGGLRQTQRNRSTTTTSNPPPSTRTIYSPTPPQPTTPTATHTAHQQHIHIDLNSILNSFTNAPPATVAHMVIAASPSPSSTATSIAKPATNAVPAGVADLAEYSQDITSIDKLRRSIVDDSILQNFQNSQQFQHNQQQQRYYQDGRYQQQQPRGNTGQRLNKVNAATITAPFIPSQRLDSPQQFPQLNIPGIVIARAEGQRIPATSVENAISSLVTRKPTKSAQTPAYVPLDDFLTHKFGYGERVAAPKTTATTYFGRPQAQAQKQQQYQQQTTPAPQQQQQNPFLQQQQQSGAAQQAADQPKLVSYNQAAPTKNPFFTPVYPSHQYTQHHTRPQLNTYQAAKPQQQQQQQQRPQQQQNYSQGSQNGLVQVAAPQFQPQRQQQAPAQYPTQQQLQRQPQPQPQQQQQQQPFNSLRSGFQQQQPVQFTPSVQTAQQKQQQQSQYQFNQQPLQQQYALQPPAVQLHTPPLQQQRELTNIFANFQQHQRQLPPFPPLNTATGQAAAPAPQPAFSDFGRSLSNNNNNNYLNIQLPAVSNGLIPAPTTQLAQKRSDSLLTDEASSSGLTLGNIDLSNFAGVSSYEVPLSSIGRLPNDITALLRRRLRRY